MGRLLKNFGLSHKLNTTYKEWLKYLPLNEDINEGNFQQDYLISLIKNNPEVVISDRDDIIKILKIYAKYVIRRRNC